MGLVVVGMDPHKRSATIEVMAGDERVLGAGRYGTDASGCRAVLRAVRHWPQRPWATGGCQGTGRHLAMRLIADGERVVDVPAKLSARTRVLATGQGRKTDATDAHSAAELISDLERICQRKKAADKELQDLLKDIGTALTSLNGIGPLRRGQPPLACGRAVGRGPGAAAVRSTARHGTVLVSAIETSGKPANAIGDVRPWHAGRFGASLAGRARKRRRIDCSTQEGPWCR